MPPPPEHVQLRRAMRKGRRSTNLARMEIYESSSARTDAAALPPMAGHALCYTIAGNWDYRYGETWHRLSPGDTNVVDLTSGSVEHRRGQSILVVFLQLLPGSIDPEFGMLFLKPIVRIDLFRHILRAAAAIDDDEFDSRIFEIFDSVSRRSLSTSGRVRGNPIRMERVKRFIESHYLERLTLAQIAESVHIGPFTCLRQFKAATGETPSDYAVRLRLKRAKQLLADHMVSVAEVAERSGFHTHPHFSRTFRLHTGMTPIMYRLVTTVH